MSYNDLIKKTKAEILENIEKEIKALGVNEFKFDENNKPILHWNDGDSTQTDHLHRIGIFDGEMHFSTEYGTVTPDGQDGFSVESLANLLEQLRETIKSGRQANINEIRSLVGNYGSFSQDNETRYGELIDIWIDDDEYKAQFKVKNGSYGFMSCTFGSLDDADIKRVLEIVKANHTGTYLINVEAKFSTQYEIQAKTADEAIALAQGIFAGDHEDVNDEYEDIKFFT